MMLSTEHAKMRIRYLEHKLASLPSGKLTKRTQHGHIYDRVKINKYPGHPEYEGRVFSTGKEPGRTLSQLVACRSDHQHELDSLRMDVIRSKSSERHVSANRRAKEPAPMRYKQFCDLKKVADSNPYPKPANAIDYKSINMRSKGEVMIAQALDELHYEYIYEPKLSICKTVYPDFAVYIPEIDKLFFIEFMGALSDPDYLPTAGEKFKNFARSGYVVGRDVIFICETGDSSIDLELLRSQINALIMANTEEFTRT